MNAREMDALGRSHTEMDEVERSRNEGDARLREGDDAKRSADDGVPREHDDLSLQVAGLSGRVDELRWELGVVCGVREDGGDERLVRRRLEEG